MHIERNTHTETYTQIPKYTNTQIHKHANTHTNTQTRTYTNANTHPHIHTDKETHMHTNTNTFLQLDLSFEILGINGPDCYAMHSFSVDGEDVEFIPFDMSACRQSDDGSLITRDTLFSDEELYRYPNARIPIEQANGKILYLASGDDQSFNSEGAARRMYKHLRECGKEETMDFVVYPKAGHLLDHPFMPFCKATYHRIYATSLAFGGIAVNHSKAQEDAWRKILAFFKAM